MGRLTTYGLCQTSNLQKRRGRLFHATERLRDVECCVVLPAPKTAEPWQELRQPQPFMRIAGPTAPLATEVTGNFFLVQSATSLLGVLP